MKRIVAFLLISILLLIPLASASAADIPSPKEEVVYGILDLDGRVDSLYVVNIFRGGAITDYGNYSEVRNLTSSEEMNQKGDQISVNTKADRFSYQGTLEKKELPWAIAIQYFLDGKEMPGAELAGKSGSLKIAMSIKQNQNVQRTFFDNYALQITLSLDGQLCSDIKADKATIVEAGGKKQLAYTLLPGNEMDIELTANVRDFEMDPITINGIRMSFDIPVDKEELTEQFEELEDAIRGLDEGAGELLDGLRQLSTGMDKYVKGLKAFQDGLNKLPEGAGKLNAGAGALKEGLSELTKQNEALLKGALAMQQAAFDAVNGKLSEMGLGLPVLTPENYSKVLSPIPQLAPVKEQLDGAVQFAQGLKADMDGVAQLGQGASELAKGTSEFKSSAAKIPSSANELYKAGAELNRAIKKLRDGFASYKEGTEELRKGTGDMDEEIQKKVDEMLDRITGQGEKTVSFVSEKNTQVSSVQFVLKTGAIYLPEAEEAPASKTVELNFWQKLLSLFGRSTSKDS